MLAPEINRKLTETDDGTPCGTLMRRYWQPVALTDELAGNRPVVPVRIFGEDLVLFRDGDGRLGLIDRHCPHRQADLCYGRLESNGLRCPFHGWLFDAEGTCLDQPGELHDNNRERHFGQAAYPCVERNGMIFGYLGPGEPPALPAIDSLEAPDSHVFAFKGFLECNYLQAVEVGSTPRMPLSCIAIFRTRIRTTPTANSSGAAPGMKTCPLHGSCATSRHRQLMCNGPILGCRWRRVAS